MFFIIRFYENLFDNHLRGALLTIVPKWVGIPEIIGLYQRFSAQTWWARQFPFAAGALIWGAVHQPVPSGVQLQDRSVSVHEAWRVQIQQRSRRSASSSFQPEWMCQCFRWCWGNLPGVFNLLQHQQYIRRTVISFPGTVLFSCLQAGFQFYQMTALIRFSVLFILSALLQWEHPALSHWLRAFGCSREEAFIY